MEGEGGSDFREGLKDQFFSVDLLLEVDGKGIKMTQDIPK